MKGKSRIAALVTAGLPLLLLPGIAAAMSLAPVRTAYAIAAAREADRTSRVAPIMLPEGGVRATRNEDIAKFREVLAGMAKAAQRHLETVEVILWQGGSAPRNALPGLLKNADYEYSSQPSVDIEGGKIMLFGATRSGDGKEALLGMWMERNDAILLAWGTVSPGAPTAADPAQPALPAAPRSARSKAAVADANDAPAPDAPAGAITLQLDAKAYTVNVMGKAMPRVPAFPKLAPKPGFVRGYVYDTNGKSLAGAKLGVRSTATGGYYSGAQGKSDAKGYYEIAVPFGAAHFYNAGYAVDYGEGRAALSLHPADGEEDGFASNVGEVENWVLLPYGIADREGVQENAKYCNNYYGGTIILSWYADDDKRWPDPKKLPPDAQFEVTLTPEGPLVDGSRGRPIVIRKPATHNVGFLGQLYVNNIPVGSYRITARLVGGGPLKMKEVGPGGGAAFGIEPKEATGTAALLLRPDSGKADEAGKAHGNWEHISIALERP